MPPISAPGHSPHHAGHEGIVRGVAQSVFGSALAPAERAGLLLGAAQTLAQAGGVQRQILIARLADVFPCSVRSSYRDRYTLLPSLSIWSGEHSTMRSLR
jgi:hypothetical protein